MTLNPAELLKQARDSNRLSDLATINTALNLFSTDVLGGFMGTSTVVYVSLPSTTSTCSNLGLPTLPSGYTYNCVTQQNLRNTDGTGWIPVNFQRISSNSPISQLPTDPINTTTTRLYYTYTPGGSWELNATVEASKNKLGGSNDLTSKDGGSAPSQYEIGNNLNLSPIEQGDPSLVGYWNFEGGILDLSGGGSNGTWYGTSTNRYVVGKIGNYAGYFNGGSDYVGFTDAKLPTGGESFTVSAWVNPSRICGECMTIFHYGSNGANLLKLLFFRNNYLAGAFYNNDFISGLTPQVNNWQFMVWSWDSVTKIESIYINDNLATKNTTGVNTPKTGAAKIGSGYNWYFSGNIDDVRVHNRALSVSEVAALYVSGR
jgi:hypothetical protein